ncbi:BatD family protein [Oleiharenicola lentus]|uniref:BatD family protein n=1 Tax=Oleiharenicola lentus TaxID=2508720 RepID=UPI003F67CE5A
MRKLFFFFSLGAASVVLAQAALPTNQPLVTPQTVDTIARSIVTTPARSYWQGEIFPLTHTITVDKRYFQALTGAYAWPTGPVNAEDWPRATSTEAQGKFTIVQTTRAYSTQAGSVKIPTGTQGVTMLSRINESTFGNQNEWDTFTLKSATPTLTFQPLPAPAPTAFAGAVGEFTLVSKLGATSGRVGEAVTWTVTLSGTGNWPEIRSLPGRVVSKDFDYVKPTLKQTLKAGLLFDGELTEELLLVPTKTGAYQLGPIRFVYFNPKEGKFQMLTSETLTLNVAPAGPGGVVANAANGSATTERVRVPSAPPQLPLDPLAGSAMGGQPWSQRALLMSCLIAPLLFLVYWFSLAAKRRWLTDSLHARRAAHNKIGDEISAVEKAPAASPDTLRFHLHEWQKAVAKLGGVTTAMPTPKQISLAIPEACWGADGGAWAQLWREANQVIYGQATALPATWVQRAREAEKVAKLPDVPLAALFMRRNLFPAIALIALMLALPASMRADAGTNAYRAGDFAAAEKNWNTASAAQPTNAVLRYNLALATAQQDRWSESAAQALAAFVLDPTSPAIRWQLQLSMDRAGIDHPFLAELSHGTGSAKIARLFSPAAWGGVALSASVIFALALGVVAWAAFAGKTKVLRWSGVAVAVLALGGGIAAWGSLRIYGELADRDIAVISQSTLLATVPTEADTGQKTSALPAGSLAKVEGQFLTWSRLKFSNGQTGWVRTKLITFLYRGPEATAE